MVKNQLPKRNWPAKTWSIKIADGTCHLAWLVLTVTLVAYGFPKEPAVSGDLAFLIFVMGTIVAVISEAVSNAHRRDIGLPSLNDEIICREAA